MKINRRIASLLFVALALPAATPDTSGNPYEAIVGRNVFSLRPPPPPPDPEDLVKKDPPPKIQLQGLTTILGRRQVLLKVQMPAKPPQPAASESYVLAEGERNGEIEVLAIDVNAGTVKFKNHGQIQDLTMKDDAVQPPTGPAAPAVAVGIPNPAGLRNIPPPPAAHSQSAKLGMNAGGNTTTFGSQNSQQGLPSRPLRNGAVPGNLSGHVGNVGNTPQPQQDLPVLSREEQAALIEINRQRAMDQGDPAANLMPPIPFRPPQ